MSIERPRHTIWYSDKFGTIDSVECPTEVADMIWDRLEKAGMVMVNTRPNFKPKRIYTGLKGERPITQVDLDKWIPE